MSSRPSSKYGFVHLFVLIAAVCAVPLFVSAYMQSVQAPASASGGSAGVVGNPTFRVAPSFPVLGNPSSVAAADLNNDGRTDLVVADAKTGTVTVLLRRQDGTFQKLAAFPVGKNPSSVVVADFNGDGKQDVAVANQADNSVSVLLGNGDGTLQPAVNYSVPKGPVFLAAGDLTGKGHRDLVVAGAGANSIVVLSNNGDGSFQAAKQFSVGATPQSLAIGDFNGDGKLDVASANADGSVSVLLADGQGGFNSLKSFHVGAALSSIVTADFDRDGHADLAVADSSADLVHILLGNGDGSFKTSASVAVGHGPASLALADVNGDQVPDLVAANQFANTVSVILGNGDGSFAPAYDFVVGNTPMAVIVADFNGDGHPDVATANFADGTISTPLGNGDGTFQAAPSYRTNLDVQSLAAGDLNGDGHLDLVVTNFCGTDATCAAAGTATVFLSNGKGSFSKGSSFALGKGPVAIALADVNGDKKLDLLAVNQTENTLSVMLGNGDGTFQQPLVHQVGNGPVAIAVADLNKDGKLDVVIANRCATSGCNQPGELNVLLGNGNGSFQPAATYTVGFSPVAVSIGDLNGDGNSDLVVANACGNSQACTSGTAGILLGDGAGKFKPGTDVNLGKLPSSVALGSLSGKGPLDLVAAYKSDNQVGVLQGNGDGTFKTQVFYNVPSGPSSIIVGDFNGDGHPDVAVANLNASTVSLLNGSGDGTLQNPVNYPVGSAPASIISAELTTKGRFDIVTANGAAPTSASHITVLQNSIPQANDQTGTTATLANVTTVTYGNQVTFTATITPAPTDSTPNDVTFKDGATTLGTGTADPSTGVATFQTTATQLTAGAHPITATFTGTTLFSASPQSAAQSQTVNTRPLTVTATGVDKIYDGITTASVTLADDRVPGDVFTDSFAAAAFPDKNVGAAKTISVTGISISGPAATNYNLGNTTATANANITTRSLTVVAAGVDKVYDRTAVASVTLSDDRVAGDVVTDSFTTATFPDKNTGIAKTVSVTGISISGTDAGNYSLSNTTAVTTANITAHALRVTATGVDKVYNGTTTATVTLSDDRTAGDVFTDSFATAVFPDKNVGTAKAISVSGISISGPDAANYSLSNTIATATANVTLRPLTVTATGVNRVYDGTTTASVTLSDNRVSGDVFTDSFTTAAFPDKVVGTGKTISVNGISTSGTDAGNYSLGNTTATATANITLRPLTVTATGVNKGYDGNSTVTVTLSDNRVAGDVFTDSFASAACPDKNAGLGRPVTVSGISISGADAANYSLTSTTATTTTNIGGRQLTVTATGVNKVYDGTATATVTLADNRVSGDVFTDNFTNANFPDKTVGTGKTISISGISISGNDAGNYSLNNLTTTATANITPRSLKVTATGVPKVYDGSTTATVNLADDRVAGDVFTDSFANANFSDKKVGIGKTVSITGISIAGNDAGNYSLNNLTATTTANITGRPLAVTAAGVDKVYDGTATATVILSDNRVAGDIFTDNSAASFPDKNVGIGKTVTVTGISLSGADSGNYLQNTTTSTTATITQRPLTVTATSKGKVYDGTTTAPVDLTDNRVPGDVVADNFTAANFPDKNVGLTKPIAVSGISISNTDSPNYNLLNTTATTTAAITQRPLHVTASADNKIYDGTTAAIAHLADDRVSGDVFTDTLGNAVFSNKNVGSGKIVTVTGIQISGTDAPNYSNNSATSTTATISPAHLTATADNKSKIFDNASFTLSAFTAPLSGFVPGETEAGLRGTGDVSGLASFTGPAISAVTAGTYTITPGIGGLKATNYDFPNFANGSLTINQAASNSLSTALVTPINDSTNGATFTFTVVVTPQFAGTPTGSVTFKDTNKNGTATLGTVQFDNAKCPANSPQFAACAQLTTSAGQVAAGLAHTITANYNGDVNFISSQFLDAITVNSAVNTAPGVSIAPVQVSLNNAEANSQTVNVQCVVQSATVAQSLSFPRCTLNTNSVALPGNVTATLSTAAVTAGLSSHGTTATVAQAGLTSPHPLANIFLGMPAIGFLALGMLGGLKAKKQANRWVRVVLGLVLMLALFALLVGCGGGFGNPGNLKPPVSGSTQAGTYTVIVTGTDVQGRTVAVGTIPLNVQF